MKKTKFPFDHFAVKQTSFSKSPQTWFACGLCSLKTCLNFLGRNDIKNKTIYNLFLDLKPSCVLKDEGISIEELNYVVLKLGLSFKKYSIHPQMRLIDLWDYLIGKSQHGIPLLIFTDYHCVAIWGVTKKGAWLMDPDDIEKPFQYLSPATLLTYWFKFNRCSKKLYFAIISH